MEIEFKKFTITNDKIQFILIYKKGEKGERRYYYGDLASLLRELPNKVLLKREAKTVSELIRELQELKKFIDFNFNK